MMGLIEQEKSLLPIAQENTIKTYSENGQIAEYIKTINKFPILNEQQEKALLVDFFENKNKNAGHLILNSHLRLVVKIAMEYKKYHASLMDLIAEGNLGLLKALQKFSLEKQVRFSTYAILWIKASIKHFLTKSISSIKAITTNTQKKLFFHLSKAKKYLDIENKISNPDEITKISNMLGVSKAEIYNHEKMIDEIKETSTNDIIYQNNDATERGETISSPESNLEDITLNANSNSLLKVQLADALSQLSKREAQIIKYRILKPEKYTLAELSTKFSISKERIRQIQENGLKKLKKILQNQENTFNTI